MKLLNMDNSCRADSLLNRLTPGTKLSLLVLLLTAVLIGTPYLGMGSLLVIMLIFYGLAGLSPFKWFRRLLPLIPLILLVGSLQVLFRIPGEEGTIFWQWKIFELSQGDFELFYHFTIRFTLIIGLFFLFTSLLSMNEISHGVEEFFRPLEKTGFPVFEAGLVITITFRFIPLLGEELEKITLAQKSRGAMQDQKKRSVLLRISDRIPLIIPLFIAALTRAENLAEAMEARGYVMGKPRSRLIHYNKTVSDHMLIILSWVILAALLAIRILDLDQRTGVYIYEQIFR